MLPMRYAANEFVLPMRYAADEMCCQWDANGKNCKLEEPPEELPMRIASW